MPVIGTKTADEIKDYGFDWSRDIGSDNIIGNGNSTWDISPATASIVSSSVSSSGLLTTVWVGGGIVGEVYTLSNRIITAAGREMNKTLRILVSANNFA